MFAKLYNLLAMFAISTLLAGSGFLAYLLVSGRFEGQRLNTIASILRGEELPQAAAEHAPATQPAPESQPAQTRPVSPEAISALRAEQQFRVLELERIREDVAARHALLEQSLQTLVQQQEQLARERKEWEAARNTPEQAPKADSGFQHELEYLSSLPPKLAKEHLMLTWKRQPADAARLLRGLPVSKGKRILEQMRTPEELQVMNQLLEQLRTNSGDAPESRKTGDDASS